MGCRSLEALNASSLTTPKVTSFQSMFSGCTNLVSLQGAESWDTSKIVDARNMFKGCENLQLDCSHWTDSEVGKGLYENPTGGFSEDAPGVVPPKWA